LPLQQERPWHISRNEVSPCQMTEEHGHELGPGPEALCVSLGTMFRYQFFKVRTRNFRENLTEQARYL
jgi:hypothetical protein